MSTLSLTFVYTTAVPFSSTEISSHLEDLCLLFSNFGSSWLSPFSTHIWFAPSTIFAIGSSFKVDNHRQEVYIKGAAILVSKYICSQSGCYLQ